MKARITMELNKGEYRCLKNLLKSNIGYGIEFENDTCILNVSGNCTDQKKVRLDPLITKIELEHKKFKEAYNG